MIYTHLRVEYFSSTSFVKKNVDEMVSRRLLLVLGSVVTVIIVSFPSCVKKEGLPVGGDLYGHLKTLQSQQKFVTTSELRDREEDQR